MSFRENPMTQPEPYVSPEKAAEFLGINGKCARAVVNRMARTGRLPAHALNVGKRRQWRFRLSELDQHMQGGGINTHPPVRRNGAN
jgi:excisionase family DNA binding protein